MLLYVFFPVLTIAFMLYCIAKAEDKLCKIIATLFLCSAAFNLALYYGFVPGLIAQYADYLIRIFMIATVLFIYRLFKTASEARSRGQEEGTIYYYIIGTALILMLAISFREFLPFFDAEWFYAYSVRIWPELAVLSTIVIMKVKGISFNKDEDNLLWYFAAASLFVLCYYFL
jgi:hypothetical protein